MNTLNNIIERCHQRHKKPLRQRKTIITPAPYKGLPYHFTVYCGHRYPVRLYDLEQAFISFMPIGRAPQHDNGPRSFDGERFTKRQGIEDWEIRRWDVSWGIQVYTGTPSGRWCTMARLNEIIYKRLYSIYHDSRTLYGDHDELKGHEHISNVINIDQSPIGRSPCSNPATYIGFYDNIRKLFASTPTAELRGYTASRFSFNVKGGRCEECHGEGTITTQLHFMPDVEVTCPTCKGARYNDDTLEVTYNDKNILMVLLFFLIYFDVSLREFSINYS